MKIVNFREKGDGGNGGKSCQGLKALPWIFIFHSPTSKPGQDLPPLPPSLFSLFFIIFLFFDSIKKERIIIIIGLTG